MDAQQCKIFLNKKGTADEFCRTIGKKVIFPEFLRGFGSFRIKNPLKDSGLSS
jgi:hypothetical protein